MTLESTSHATIRESAPSRLVIALYSEDFVTYTASVRTTAPSSFQAANANPNASFLSVFVIMQTETALLACALLAT